jgi:DNA-binding Lrp family transcriptional regulator
VGTVFAYNRAMRAGDDLDHHDLAILATLRRNARISNKRLAETVGLAPSTCLERVRRLVELGVLRGFHADLDLAPLDMGMQAMIAVRMREHSRELVDSFRAYALSLPQVLGVFHVSGADDFLVHVAVRDAHHLRDLALDAFTTRPEVDRIETRLIFEHMSSWTLPGPLPPRG